MFGFRIKPWQNGLPSPSTVTSPGPVCSPAYPESPGSTSSPKTDVGEIDTRAPIKSVRSAVSLFGDVISPTERAPVSKKTIKAEEQQQLLENETQHHVVFRELDYYKDKLRSIESAKAQASRDLNRANIVLQELTNKLEALSESKQSAIQGTEDAKRRSQQLEEQKSLKAKLGNDKWKLAMEAEYKASTGQLIASKQELTSLRQDVDATLEAKLAAFQEQEDAQQARQINLERKSHLSKEVNNLRETLGQVIFASLKAQEEHLKLTTEKKIYVLVQKSTMEDADTEIQRMKEACNGPLERLEEANGAIVVLREQLDYVRTSDLRSLEDAVSELDFNKMELKKFVEEKNLIQECVDSLRLELEDARRTRSECEERALELELRLEKMQKHLESRKTELEEAKSGSAVWDDMWSKLENKTAEAEKGRCEAEGLSKEVELLRKEAEVANFAAREAGEKLEAALKEVQAALAAEKLADEKIHDSPRNDSIAVESKGAGSFRRIRLSAEEFEAMNQKMEDCNNEADEKVAILMGELHMITTSGNQVSRKVERVMRENEDMKSEIEDAVKRAEMAEDAKKLVEVELQKWRQEKGDGEVGEPSYKFLKKPVEIVETKKKNSCV